MLKRQKQRLAVKMLEVLLRKTSFLVLFAEKALAEIPSSASIAGDRYIEDEVV